MSFILNFINMSQIPKATETMGNNLMKKNHNT